MTYVDVLLHQKPVGQRVAIIGAGGIGFDVAEYLCHDEGSGAASTDSFNHQWGIDSNLSGRGGVQQSGSAARQADRQIFLLQRKPSRPGKDLGKTTGWIHRTSLKARGVEAIAGVGYRKVDNGGLHIAVDRRAKVLDVDSVIICAGQEPRRDLVTGLEKAGLSYSLVGGADQALELDAKRAIEQASRLAAEL